ncbi:hypothetical protein GWI33_006906 [Rhynchophorus ferrugineus]|uniref:Uncharacterized protein n=1 Tax=Rhynchophorus ferrugineus TaxID=354439 RepID=A0A834IW56_RHYFE|nr:hypothetical protein GWI33_006906 [Rhynchophorus ferrugineus]
MSWSEADMLAILLIISVSVLLVDSVQIRMRCGNFTIRSIRQMCLTNSCLDDDLEVQEFCHNLYESIFKCPFKMLPINFLCDGINHCNNGMDENPTICKYKQCKSYEYKCSNGQCIEPWRLCNGIPDCLDGLDESVLTCRQLLSKNNARCPVIIKEGHSTTCYLNYGAKMTLLSCNQTLPPATVMDMKCKPFYIDSNNTNHKTIICQGNGTWNLSPLDCKTDCGAPEKLKIEPLILHGFEIKPHFWPWYSVLYTEDGDKWVFFCSSTLISTRVVLTAAHCVWEIPKHKIRVGAGKYSSDFYAIEKESQFRTVTEIFTHPLYQDILGNYGSDLSLLIVNRAFRLSNTVLPICINWSLRNILNNWNDNMKGMVAGMGIMENGSLSPFLRASVLQIISNERCIAEQAFEFRKFVSITSFCAGTKDGTTLCNGDSGSGLAVFDKHSGKWFLEGVVSVSLKDPNTYACNSSHYSIFTNVGMYVDWIYPIYLKYNMDYN